LEIGEDPGAFMSTTELFWKIYFLGQTSCVFPWRLLQTLPHSHNVIFHAD